MTSWRSINNQSQFTIQPKYQMEIMSAYLIDRVHFLHSDDSLLLQVCDIMTFIMQRTLVHEYLSIVDPKRVDLEKLPITRDGWAIMSNQIFPSTYSERQHDVLFCGGILEHSHFLFDLSLINENSMKLHEHYKQMQPTSK
jgi:hypothetical protein